MRHRFVLLGGIAILATLACWGLFDSFEFSGEDGQRSPVTTSTANEVPPPAWESDPLSYSDEASNLPASPESPSAEFPRLRAAGPESSEVLREQNFNDPKIQHLSSEEFRGQVLGTEGDPIAGASIRLSPEIRHSESPQDRLTRTDDSGQFALRGLSPGIWFLSARHPDRHTLAGLRVEVPSAEPVRVVMPPDRPSLLRAVDEEGIPLAGVRITARISPGGDIPGQVPAVRAITGSDGEALLRGLPADDATILVIQANLRGRPQVSVTRTAGELRRDALVVEMGSGGSLGGLVMDPAGIPQANVRLILISSVQDPSHPGRWSLYSTAQGEFLFRGIPRGEYTLFADGGERGRCRITALRVEPDSTRSSKLQVQLSPLGSPEAEEAIPPRPLVSVRSLRSGRIPGTGTVQGRVTAEGPVPAFSIGLAPAKTGSEGDAPKHIYRQTARRPEFQLTNVPPGTYQVLLIVDGEVRTRSGEIQVKAGGRTDPVVLRLGDR